MNGSQQGGTWRNKRSVDGVPLDCGGSKVVNVERDHGGGLGVRKG